MTETLRVAKDTHKWTLIHDKKGKAKQYFELMEKVIDIPKLSAMAEDKDSKFTYE
jgi:hypothetical protein